MLPVTLLPPFGVRYEPYGDGASPRCADGPMEVRTHGDKKDILYTIAIYEPYGGGSVPLAGIDPPSGDRPLSGNCRKLRFLYWLRSSKKTTIFYPHINLVLYTLITLIDIFTLTKKSQNRWCIHHSRDRFILFFGSTDPPPLCTFQTGNTLVIPGT